MFVAALILALSATCAVGPTLAFQLQHGRVLTASGGGGYMLPLRQREVSSRRRHLLRSGALAVQGAVREVGYFYTTVSLGTPARTFSVIIDTGSTITYIPCKGCAHCGKHTDEWFDPDASTTANKLGCGDPLCNCGSPSCSCNNNRCYYSRTYAERSSSEGWLIEDVFAFPDDQPPVRMVFGCENGETGEIYRQMADGIMGMGNNYNAFQSQLVKRGVIEDVFSLCFGYPKDGILLLGDVAMPPGSETVYTPLLNNLHMHYYNVKMDAITVNGQQLPLDQAMFDRGYGVVLDSGTTFTYLPTDAFNVMSKAIGDYVETKGLKRTPGADPQYNDICWKGAPDEFQGLDAFFPAAQFVFGGGAHLQLPPLRYLFLSRPSEYCLGFFDNGNSGTLIGGVSVRDMVVTYDRHQNRVGFTALTCSDVAKAIASRSANSSTVAASPPPPQPSPPSAPPPSPPPPPPPTPMTPVRLDSPPPPSTTVEAAPPPPPPASVLPSLPPSPRATDSTDGLPLPASDTLAIAPQQPIPPYHAPVTQKASSSTTYGTIIVVVIVIIAMFMVAEVYVFRRRWILALFSGVKQRMRGGAQDETELAPLAGGGGKFMSGPSRA